MARCRKCRYKVAWDAETCPQCGAKQPKRSSPTAWGILLVAIGGLGLLMVLHDPLAPRPAPPTASSTTRAITVPPKPTPTGLPTADLGLGDYARCYYYHVVMWQNASTEEGKRRHLADGERVIQNARMDGWSREQVEGAAGRGADALAKVASTGNVQTIMDTLRTSCDQVR